MPGGVVGGVVGGLEPLAPPPPPPPPPPAPRGPIRIGGQIKEPALIYRVEPVYPGVAISANIEGTVILEAIVDEEGRVETREGPALAERSRQAGDRRGQAVALFAGAAEWQTGEVHPHGCDHVPPGRR